MPRTRPSLHRLAETLAEITASPNVGPFPVPIGGVLTRYPGARDPDPLPEVDYKVPEEYAKLYR